MSAPTVDRVGNIRGLLDDAKSNLCIGWDSTERQMDPTKVLEALAGIECALKELTLLESNLADEDEADRIRDMASALQSKARPQ